MQIRKLLFGMGLVLSTLACSRTPLPAFRDAGAETRLAPDAGANPDLAFSNPDSATPGSDMAAVDAPGDAAAPDDAGGDDLLARDTSGADAVASDLLAREAGADIAEVLAGDVATPDVVAG